MLFCKKCGVPLNKVWSFSEEGNYEFFQCPKCYFKTKSKVIDFSKEDGKQENNRRKYKNNKRKRDT